MTACRNKASRAVTAALVGVLSVGAVPMVALAQTGAAPMTEATANEAYDRGTVVEFKIGKKTVKDSQDAGEIKMSALEKNVIVITSVRPDGAAADPVDSKGTWYYKEVKKDDASYQINGKYYKYCGSSATDFAALTPGNYIAVTDSDSNIPADKTTNVKAPAVSFKVVSDSLDDVTLGEPIYDVNGAEIGYSETFTYDDRTSWSDVKLMLDGEEFTDGSYEAYVAEDDEGDEALSPSATVQAGDYKIVIKGTGDYEGERVVDLHVDKLDLSKADLYLDDVVMPGGKPTLTDIKGSDVAAFATGLKDQYLNFDIKGNTWGSDGAGEYTYELTVKPDTIVANNVTGTAKLKFNRLNEGAAKVDWTYSGDNKWVRSDEVADPNNVVIEIDRSQAKDDFSKAPWLLKDFDASKLAGSYVDEAGKTVELDADDISVTIKDEDGNVVSDMSKKGVYTIVVEAKSANFGWDVQRSVSRVTAKVFNGTVGDADTVFTYGGEVKSGTITTTYSGQDVLAGIGVQVRDDKGNLLTEGEDYVVTATNTDTDEEVDEIVDAGNYVVTVSSDTYMLDGAIDGVESIDVTVDPFDISKAGNARVKFPTLIVTKDGEFIPYTGQDITPVIEVALTKDADGDPIWTALDTKVYDLSYTYDHEVVEGGSFQSEKEVDSIKDLGWYKVIATIDGDETANFVGELQDANGTDGYEVSDAMVFADVPGDAYYAQSVYDANAQGYIYGMGGTNLFAPNNSISRADMAVMLFRMAGGELRVNDGKFDVDMGYVTKFEDCDENAYYAKAVAWATQVGIVSGYDATHFGPADKVTTEQFAVMLANYAKAAGKYEKVDVDATLAGVSDGSSVSAFAREQVAWAVENGYIAQGGAAISPQAEISRGRVVTIAVRYQPEVSSIVAEKPGDSNLPGNENGNNDQRN